MKVKISAILLSVFAFCFSAIVPPAAAQQKVSLTKNGVKTSFFPLSDIREGMTGKAYTVFRGTEPEEFSVEILGIVPGAIGPKQDMIVGRISGGSADRTAVFAGMSGSPVYIDGKLVGAIAYSFPFSKEPICGITPIDQMIGIFKQYDNQITETKTPKPFSFSEIAVNLDQNFSGGTSAYSGRLYSNVSTGSALNAYVGQTFRPIATPVSFNGLSALTLKAFEKQLLDAGLLPVASVGGSAPISPMKNAEKETLIGGTSVSMQLARGDFSLAAAGTVTFRDGEKIYAFGHPFLSLGTSDLPMSESSVVTVIPNLNNSFKLAVPGAMVGSMTQDRATGVFGKLGQAPKMIPVRIEMTTSRNQKQYFNFEVARDDGLTPLLVNIGIYNALVSNERGMGDSTVEIDSTISLKDQKSVKMGSRFSGSSAVSSAALSVALPVNAILTSRFDDVDITGIDVVLKSFDGSKNANLERISIDRAEVRAGETIELNAFIRTDTGKLLSQRIPVSIPASTPTGKLLISVGDGNSIQQASISKQFVPQDLGELVKTINESKKTDRLYVQINRVSNGAIVGATELPNLPPSMLATMNNNRTAGGFTPTVQTVLTEHELAPAEFLISGQQTLSIEVIK